MSDIDKFTDAFAMAEADPTHVKVLTNRLRTLKKDFKEVWKALDDFIEGEIGGISEDHQRELENLGLLSMKQEDGNELSEKPKVPEDVQEIIRKIKEEDGEDK